MRILQKDISKINFTKSDGLVPAVVQDYISQKVLMVAYMNEEALKATIESGKVTFFSRSKGRLWTKGETSGNFLHLKKILHDCDYDTLLIKVDPVGPACHTGADTCFDEINRGGFLARLQRIIEERKANPQEGSYTNRLFQKGINKIAQKVGEEAVELVIEAKDQNNDLFLNEASDLLYHFLVLLTEKGFALEDVEEILRERHK